MPDLDEETSSVMVNPNSVHGIVWRERPEAGMLMGATASEDCTGNTWSNGSARRELCTAVDR